MDTFDEKNQSCKISRYCTFKSMNGCRLCEGNQRKKCGKIDVTILATPVGPPPPSQWTVRQAAVAHSDLSGGTSDLVGHADIANSAMQMTTFEQIYVLYMYVYTYCTGPT